MKITASFPPLDQAMLLELQRILLDKFDYPALPKDYIAFLLTNNGGFVVPGYIESKGEGLQQEELVFETPLKEGKGYWEPCIYSFFSVWLPNSMSKSNIEDRTLPNLIASNQHSKHDFNVLPEQMMSIAGCTHPSTADLLCIGLDKRDYGSVYFYFSQWFNPAFNTNKSYYDQKTTAILDKYHLNSVHDKAINEAAQFEIDRIPFIKVADSFSDFLTGLKTKKIAY